MFVRKYQTIHWIKVWFCSGGILLAWAYCTISTLGGTFEHGFQSTIKIIFQWISIHPCATDPVKLRLAGYFTLPGGSLQLVFLAPAAYYYPKITATFEIILKSPEIIMFYVQVCLPGFISNLPQNAWNADKTCCFFSNFQGIQAPGLSPGGL